MCSAFVAASVLLALSGGGLGGASVGVGCDMSGGRAVNVGVGANYLSGISVRSACDAWAPDRLLVPDVEGLLLRCDDAAVSGCLVPLDAAYALLARLAPLWRPPDGGLKADAEVTAVLTAVAHRAAPPPR